MARVVVVHPPTSIARDYIDYPYMADLGAVQVAAVLRQAGHEVRLVNALALSGSRLEARPDGRLHLGASVADVLDAVGETDIAIVAYTPFHRPPYRDSVLGALLAGLRAERVILADCYQSGQHYVEAPGDEVLASYPEAGTYVKYECETSLLDVIVNDTRGVVRGIEPQDLDELPFPAWDLVDLRARDRLCETFVRDLGRSEWAFPIDGRTLPAVTSRGCPFRCAHCSSNPGRPEGAAKTQRRYSEARMRAYFEQLVRAHGATRIEILDELVNVNERHFDGFLDAIDALDVKFDVPNGMRADYLFAGHLRKMRGRVRTVSVSAESGVQRVVTEVVGKRLDLANVVRVAEDAHREGVSLMIHYIIGLPGETAAEINGTLSFALDLWERFGATPAVQFATPLPGTDLARGRKLPLVTDWGPLFQTSPSQPGALVSADDLARFKRAFDERLHAPSLLRVNLTYACNNRCSFCAVAALPSGRAAASRTDLVTHYERGIRAVVFDGGEPTLDAELIPLIQLARTLGYRRVTVVTNGRMCFYERYATALVTSGLTSLEISVHGADVDTHGRHVGVAEAFEQTMLGIAHCVRHAPDDLTLAMNVTLTRDNLEQLDALAELALAGGLKRLNVQFLTPFGAGTTGLAPETAAAARATGAMIDRCSGRLDVRIRNLPYCYLPQHEHRILSDHRVRMSSTNDAAINLPAYLAERRIKKPVCAACPWSASCDGFFDLADAPAPRWLVSSVRA